jgi:hypothetical protein
MPPDILQLLSGLGVPGQIIGYVAMIISIATVLVRYLPPPAGTGAYRLLWGMLSRVAHLRAPSGATPSSASGSVPPVSAVLLCLALLGGGLAGCATSGNATQQAQQLASDVELIAGGLEAALPAIGAIRGAPKEVLDRLGSEVAVVQKDAAAISAALGAHAAVPVPQAQEIAGIVGDVASTIIPEIPGGVAFLPVIQAAQALVPELLAAAGIAAAAPVEALPSPEVARAILVGQTAQARAMLMR